MLLFLIGSKLFCFVCFTVSGRQMEVSCQRANKGRQGAVEDKLHGSLLTGGCLTGHCACSPRHHWLTPGKPLSSTWLIEVASVRGTWTGDHRSQRGPPFRLMGYLGRSFLAGEHLRVFPLLLEQQTQHLTFTTLYKPKTYIHIKQHQGPDLGCQSPGFEAIGK